MVGHLTEKGRDMVLLKLATENNAFLRILLSNQVLIMEALKIDCRLPSPFPEEIVDDIGNPDKKFRDYLVAADQIALDVMQKVYDYAAEHGHTLNTLEDLGL